MSAPRVLVTGASGFVGRQCVRALLERGCEVHGVSRSVCARTDPGVVWHPADILQQAAVQRLLAECKPTHLIHCAWNISHQHYTSGENLLWAARSVDLLHEAQCSGVQRIVGIGTCAEYGLDHEVCSEDSSEMHPVGTYAQAKYATQVLYSAIAAGEAFSAAWARLFFPYGPFDRPSKFVPYTINQLSKGKPAEFSAGEQERDLLFASDVGDAIVAILFSALKGAVNVGSGTASRVSDVVRRIGELMGRPDLIRLGVRQSDPLQAKRWVASVKRLKHEVQWNPSTTLTDGLRTTIAAFTVDSDLVLRSA